jgi:hypothetical protein
MIAFRTGLTTWFITFQDRSIEGVSTMRAFVFDGRHDSHDTGIAPAEQVETV